LSCVRCRGARRAVRAEEPKRLYGVFGAHKVGVADYDERWRGDAADRGVVRRLFETETVDRRCPPYGRNPAARTQQSPGHTRAPAECGQS
jgi:hypothetical protein